MSASNSPMQFALLVAALAQLLPTVAFADKAEKDAEETRVCEDCPEISGRSMWIEGGIGIQSDDSYHFGRYTGLQDSGALVNLNGEVTYRGSLNNGAYLNGKIIDLGLDSRLLSVEGGRQGKYGIGLEYDQIPNFRKKLTNKLLSSSTSLETRRDRLGVKFSKVTGKAWEVTGYFRHEEKDGTRDNAASFAMSDPQILAVPVDYQTDDFGVALGYLGERMQARFAYDGSLFKNDHNAITWDNPSAGPAQGRIAESPDNQFHQLSAQLGYQLSDRTRLGASFARGRMKQNQDFLDYGTASTLLLPANSLKGEVETTLVKLDVNSHPSPKVRLDASYTYSDRDNDTPVRTFNYVIADADPVTGLITRQNRPYGFEQNLLRLKAAYRFTNGTDLSAGYDNDKMERTYRQVEDTRDHTLWAKLRFQPLENVQASFKVSHADRDASTYDPTLYQNPDFPNSGANPGDPLLKPFELADRKRDKIGFDVAYAGLGNLSLGLNVDYYKDDYENMVLGLTEASGVSVTPTLTYAFNERLSASAYYNWEKLESKQSGREWTEFPPPTPTYSVLWLEEDTNLTQTVGLSINWKAIPEKLDLGADVTYADFTGEIKYPGSSDLPDLESTLTAIGVHGIYRLKDHVSLRVDYRYERFKDSDWANVLVPTVTTLGVSPKTQETHLIYLSVRYAFK